MGVDQRGSTNVVRWTIPYFRNTFFPRYITWAYITILLTL